MDEGAVLAVAQDLTDVAGSWGLGSPQALPLPTVDPDVEGAGTKRCAVCDFFQLAYGPMAIADAGGRIVHANAAWRMLLGYHPEDLPGRSLQQLVHPADRDAAVACFQRALAGSMSGKVTCRMRMARGGTRVIRWRISLDPDSGRVRLAGRDRGDAIRATEAAEHIASIVEGVPKPIFSLDDKLVVWHVNAAACRVFGYRSGEMLGKSIDFAIPGLSDLLRNDADADRMASWGRKPLTLEQVGVRKDRVRFPVRVSVSEASSGPDRSLVVLARDLTQDRLDQARSLDEARAVEASAIQVRLANELHDGLLQSLTGASLQLEILRNLLRQGPPEALDRLAALQAWLAEEQRELRFFVDEFKSHGEGWGSHDAPIEERLTRLLSRMEQIWEVRYALNTRVDAEPSMASAHEAIRVIHEAVANAARHGNATEIAVQVECLAGEVLIRVEDDGRGFPFEGRRTLEELQDEDLGPQRIMQRVLDGGGRMQVESSPAGARLTVRLPAEPSES
jgi:PAS domain S-box-containing protein